MIDKILGFHLKISCNMSLFPLRLSELCMKMGNQIIQVEFLIKKIGLLKSKLTIYNYEVCLQREKAWCR